MANNQNSNTTNIGTYNWSTTINSSANTQYQAARIQLVAAKEHKSAAKSMADSSTRLVKSVLNAVNILFEKELEAISVAFDTTITRIEAQNKISLQGVENVIKGYTSSISSTLSGITDGVNESAYSAASNLVDLTASLKKYEIDKNVALKESEMDISLRNAKYMKNINNLNAKMVSSIGTGVTQGIGEVAELANGVEIAGFGVGNLPSEAADIVGQAADFVTGFNERVTDYAGQIELSELEGTQKVTKLQLENAASVSKAWIDAGAEVQKAWLQFSQKLETRMVTDEKAANSMGIDLGLNGKQLDNFKKNMFEVQQTVSSNWGKTMEDVYKLQSSYAETTGRNIQMSNEDINETFANGILFGDDVIMQMNSGAEILGMSISNSNELMFEMYKKANKMGLNAKAYGKTLVQSLKTAEKYQFKGGVKGLADMAKWAMNTRFNLSNLESAISSIHEGGLEGLITKSANLQVLGGNFSTLSDPLRMAWLSYNDPAGLAKTFNKMLEGIGKLGADGELKINPADQMRLEAFAKETGQNIEDVRNQVRQTLRGDKVSQNLSKDFNWTDEQKALITNKAFKKDGRWVVKMNEADENGNWEKDVNELTIKDLEHLYPADNEEKLVSYVFDIRDMMTQLAGVKEGAQSKLENDGYYTWVQEEKNRMLNVTSDFREQYETYLKRFKASMEYATTSQKTFEEMMSSGQQQIDDASDSIKTSGDKVAKSLDAVNTELIDTLKKIKESKAEYEKGTASEVASFWDKVVAKTVNSTVDNGIEWGITGALTGGPKGIVSNLAENFVYELTKNASKYFGEESTYGKIVNGIAETEHFFLGNEVQGLYDNFIKDGAVYKDGKVTRIDDNDQVLAAKEGGPIDKLLNNINTERYNNDVLIDKLFPKNVIPQPMKYNSFVQDNPYFNSKEKNDKIEIEPIKITIDGNIKVNGINGGIDITQQISNDPNFIRSLAQLISIEVEKKVNGGRVNNILNRGLKY